MRPVPRPPVAVVLERLRHQMARARPVADRAGLRGAVAGARAEAARAPGDRPSPAVRVETDVGPLLLPAGDRVMLPLISRDGYWEREEGEQLRALLRPGMAFVDVGAHVGYMSLLMAQAVGPAGWGVALEPAPGNLPLLRANLAANQVANVAVLPVAAWHTTGRVPFSLSAFNTGDNRAFVVPGTEALEVAAVALDDVLPRRARIDVVKVDAQGTDHHAIAGMERSLRASRSVLVVEYWPPGIVESGEDPLVVLAYYRDFGYRIRVVGQDHTGPEPSLQSIVDLCAARPTEFCNLLLRPGW